MKDSTDMFSIEMHEEDDLTSCIPQWLIDDIEELSLADLRISCVIYELFKHYEDKIKGCKEKVTGKISDDIALYDRRLDWIDNHIRVIYYAVTNYYVLELE